MVKFSCGCIGFLSPNEDEFFCVFACDAEDDPTSIVSRPRQGKTYEPLEPEQGSMYLAGLNQIIANGQKYSDLKKIVRSLMR